MEHQESQDQYLASLILAKRRIILCYVEAKINTELAEVWLSKCSTTIALFVYSWAAHLPFCPEALFAHLAVLRVLWVVDFEVKSQRAELLEALVALAAVEALLLAMHLGKGSF